MTGTLRFLPLTLVLACGSAVDLRPPHGGQHLGDTGASGSATDTGGDAGSVGLEDDGGGPGGGTDCTLDDLRWDAGVRREGASRDDPDADQIDSDDVVVAVGSVSNPCDEPVVIDEPDSCLVRGFDLVDVESGEGGYQQLDCYESTRQTELASGEVAETALDWGQLAPGDYLLTAHFSVEGRTATTTFIVR